MFVEINNILYNVNTIKSIRAYRGYVYLRFIDGTNDIEVTYPEVKSKEELLDYINRSLHKNQFQNKLEEFIK